LNYILANIFAFSTSWQLHSYRRRSYRDLANYKQAQADLEEHTKNLERVVAERTEKLKDDERLAAIGATAGIVGHDIRNPLTAITGAVYVANKRLNNFLDGKDKEDLKENLNFIGDQTLYVNKIVADLQDYARPLNPEIAEANVENLFQSVLSTLKVPANIQVNRLVDQNFPPLRTDPDYIRRIMFNLCNNAVQAMPNGGTLTIRAACNGRERIFTAEDTGWGFLNKQEKNCLRRCSRLNRKGRALG
jgi:signal transduction histidine kinase